VGKYYLLNNVSQVAGKIGKQYQHGLALARRLDKWKNNVSMGSKAAYTREDRWAPDAASDEACQHGEVLNDSHHRRDVKGCYHTEPEFLNFKGDEKSIPRIQFRQAV
jgi:hypothetical protein